MHIKASGKTDHRHRISTACITVGFVPKRHDNGERRETAEYGNFDIVKVLYNFCIFILGNINPSSS